mgnify:CR=1 FL=1
MDIVLMNKYGMDTLQLSNVTKIVLQNNKYSIWIGEDEDPAYSDLDKDETMFFIINAAQNPLDE